MYWKMYFFCHNIALDSDTSDGTGFNMKGIRILRDTHIYGLADQNITSIFFSLVLKVEYNFSGKCFQKYFIMWGCLELSSIWHFVPGNAAKLFVKNSSDVYCADPKRKLVWKQGGLVCSQIIMIFITAFDV